MKLNSETLDYVANYLSHESIPLICIVGPTGSGKTSIALELAKKFNGELINADSRQIYRGIECITGLDYDEISGVKNHLFGTKEITEDFSVAIYLSEVRKIIKEIILRKNIPIIVGGTGLFISSLIEGYEIPDNSKNPVIKELFKGKTNNDLFEELKQVDPESALIIHPNNRVYIERALEVFYSSGTKKSVFLKNEENKYKALIITKKIDNSEERKVLYEKIDNRQKLLFNNSIEQIQSILQKDLSDSLQSMKSIGINEIRGYLKGELTKDEAISEMQKRARNYAKRQMTWWRPKENKYLFLYI